MSQGRSRQHSGHTYEDQMLSGVTDGLSFCCICHVQLDQPERPETSNCGGDCLKCMAEAGDIDCARTMKALGRSFDDTYTKD